jgi:hypothetical protein
VRSPFKIKEKGEKTAKNYPVNNTLVQPLPHRRHLEMNNPAKKKEIIKKSKLQVAIAQKS